MDPRAQQFRSVQKRLLVKFKERNPTSTNHLDLLLSATYQQLNVLSQQLSSVEAELKAAANILGCSTMVVLLSLRFQHNIDLEVHRLAMLA